MNDDRPDPDSSRNVTLALAEAERLIEGDARAAAAKARDIIAVAPSNAGAYRLLGAALRRLGEDQEASEAELAAIEASGQDPDLVRAGEALDHGDFQTSEAILRSILRSRPTDVAALRMLGEIAASVGALRDAEGLFRRALELAPTFEFARLYLAIALHQQNRSGEALAELNKMTGDLTQFDQTKALRAAAMARVGEYHPAILLYRELVASDPNNLEARTSLVFLLKTVGQAGEAVEECRSTLRIAPYHGEAWWMLADLKTYDFSDSDIETLKEAIGSTGVSDDDRLRLHFTLGKALEDRGDTKSSFEQYRRGNELRATQVRHDPTHVAQLVDRTERLFTREFIESRAAAGHPAPDPIFIVGMPRSGSTLVEQILASHPLIEGTAELPDIYVLARSLEPDPRFNANWQYYPQLLADVPAEQLRQLGQLYLDRTRIQRKSDRPFFIDKMPNNWAHVGFIQLILPNAKIIDVRRHPMACGFSNFKQLYARGHEFSYTLEHFGQHYCDYLRLMAHFDRVMPRRIHHITHETLVGNPEQEIRRLLDFVGVPFDEACLRFHETDRPVRTASAEQVRQPMRADLLDEWRAFESELGLLRDALGPAIEEWDRFDHRT